MSEQRLNIELFKKIRKRIAAIPESYNQSWWMIPTSAAPCGTAACLAGETIICNAPSIKAGLSNLAQADRRGVVGSQARRALGLAPGEAATVFGYIDGGFVSWPEPFASQFRDAENSQGRAAAAVAYLDHIIETGKVLE